MNKKVQTNINIFVKLRGQKLDNPGNKIRLKWKEEWGRGSRV